MDLLNHDLVNCMVHSAQFIVHYELYNHLLLCYTLNMKTDTAQKIIEYITENAQASPKDLYNLLDISPRAVFKQLNVLYRKNLIQKVGSPPKVYYTIASKELL